MNETDITGAAAARDDEQLQQSAFATMMPGRQLALRREEMGLSIEQAASQLNLAPRQIQAIEADNYAALPGMATARGFVRAYAKLLRLDPAPLLATIAAETTAIDEAIPLRRALSSKPFSDNRLSSPKERSGVFPKATLAAVAVAGLLAALFAGQRMGWISVFPASVAQKIDKGITLLSDSSPSPAAAGSTAASVQEDARPPLPVTRNMDNASAASAASVAAGSSTSAASSAPVAAGSNASVPAAPAQASAVASMPPSEAATQTTTAQTQAPGAGNVLVLKLREDSWIDVRKPNKTAIISRLVKAGSTESIDVTGPVSLTVGNVKGVDATLRGAPLGLRARAKNNVARLNLK